MSRELVSTEFDCRRISVIVHRSAIDKLAVDWLVLLVWGWVFFRSKREKECLVKFPIKDLRTRVWPALQDPSKCLYIHSYTHLITLPALNECLLVHNFQNSSTECHWQHVAQKSVEVRLHNKCHKIYLSGPFGIFCLYVTLTISYLRAQTIETSSLPTDSSRPLFKQIKIFQAYWLYISTVGTFLNIRASY